MIQCDQSGVHLTCTIGPSRARASCGIGSRSGTRTRWRASRMKRNGEARWPTTPPRLGAPAAARGTNDTARQHLPQAPPSASSARLAGVGASGSGRRNVPRMCPPRKCPRRTQRQPPCPEHGWYHRRFPHDGCRAAVGSRGWRRASEGRSRGSLHGVRGTVSRILGYTDSKAKNAPAAAYNPIGTPPNPILAT